MNKFTNKLLDKAMPYNPQQRFSELNPFLEFIMKDVDCNHALEIGTANGGLTYVLSRLFEKVVTIDIVNEVQYEKDNIIRLIANSHNLSIHDLEKVTKFAPYDLIFIDGDHSYEGVKQDFLLFRPLLKMSGVIALHDIKNGTVQIQNQCFVWKFIQEREYFTDFDSYIVFNEYTDEWGGERNQKMKDHGGIQCWFNQPEGL